MMPQNRTFRICNWLAGITALIVSVLIPLAYYAISYKYAAGSLESATQINSRLISNLINANPEMWQFEEPRLNEILTQRCTGCPKEVRRIVDLRNRVVAESADPLDPPLLTRTHDLRDAGVTVAKIEISRSLRPLLVNTSLAALLGLCVGVIIFTILRILPFRAVIRAERSLQEANEFLTRIMESTTNAIAVIDREGKVILANRRWAEICVCGVAELTGQHYSRLFPAGGFAKVKEHLDAVSTEGVAVQFQAELPRGNRQRYLWCGAAPLSQEGRVVGLVLSAEDITQRKEAEAKIEVLNTDLAARAAELEASNRELEAFSYTVSHDLRLPLTNIICSCDALIGANAGTMDEKSRKFAGYIHDEVRRMGKLIDAILKLSASARREVKRETVDLSGLARAIATELRMEQMHRQASFLIADGLTCDGDPVLLKVVLANLLGNAWKYSSKKEKTVIELGMTELDGNRTYFVRDNGAGFDMRQADKLFDAFQRLPGHHEFAGTGIGLATAKRIIQRHGGRIWAEGEEGKGATFYFTL